MSSITVLRKPSSLRTGAGGLKAVGRKVVLAMSSLTVAQQVLVCVAKDCMPTRGEDVQRLRSTKYVKTRNKKEKRKRSRSDEHHERRTGAVDQKGRVSRSPVRHSSLYRRQRLRPGVISEGHTEPSH